MRLLQWHQAFSKCTSLDELRHCWNDVARQYRFNPGYETPEYCDALLSFIATSPLPAPCKLGALLTCVSGFDFDLRLAVGALGDALDEAGSEWPVPFGDEAALLGPCVPFGSRDSKVESFALGRLTGLRDTLRQDGKTAAQWCRAFWNAYLELACRWADHDALEIALQHGATVEQASSLAIRQLAEGVHAHQLRTPYYHEGRTNADYVAILDRLRASGLDVQCLSNVLLPAAAAVDNTAMLESLVARSANLAAAGGQALAAAAGNCAHGAVEWLLAHGVDVHANQDAALVGAVAALDKTMVDTLLDACADVHANDELPLRTAFQARPVELFDSETDFASERADLVVLLLQRGANPAHPALTDALRASRDGEAVLVDVLARTHLEAPCRSALAAAGTAAFGWALP